MKKLTTLLIVLIIASTTTFAQTGTIKGTVKDKKTGKPLFNVAVFVKEAGTIRGDAANLDGKYTIKPLNVGKYTLTAKIPGYKTLVTKDVDITSGNITFVDINLEPTAEKLPEITFAVYKDKLIDKGEPQVQKILPDELKHTVNLHNPLAIVTTLPGVTLAPNGKDVYIRGARPTSTQFIIDGMKSITGGIDIPAQAIGSIKVYTGGIPAQYGDVTGGVIVIETKSYFDLVQAHK